ncbi:N-acetylmuramoyl-L-alanine amidase family protein [Gracilibacillus timonensis]|uniref:N-acetylmuramoyl-L-alanine amidase family protein n=1 Tax=Gracilibacillus timonensis TaxID=1816696 RepID=UPI0008271323|nr:N-acetylmuramoyl-L-alanine amidase [Gracilibacillus timonensis]
MNKKMRFLICSLILMLIAIGFIIDQKPFMSDSKEEPNNQENDHLEGTVAKDSTGEKYKIIIDPGHGGEDPGSIGVSGSYEKDFTLSLAMKVFHLMDDIPRIEVYMTRDKDVFLSAETRVRPKFANDLKADLYISLHANTFTDPSVSGTETYYYDQSSFALANMLHKYVAEATGFRNRGVKKEDLFVLRDTNMPAILLEIGYMTNPKEEQTMLTETFQQQVAKSIKNGVKEYLKIDG